MKTIEINDETYEELERISEEQFTPMPELIADIVIAFKVHVLGEED